MYFMGAITFADNITPISTRIRNLTKILSTCEELAINIVLLRAIGNICQLSLLTK